MTDLPPQQTPVPQSPQVVVPGGLLTWPKLLTICVAIVVAAWSVVLGLTNLVYSDIKNGISRLDAQVATRNSALMTASKDAGSLQALLNEAPDLRKNIQETRDAVIRLDAKFDRVESQVTTLVAGSSEIQTKLDNLSSTVQRIPGLPK